MAAPISQTHSSAAPRVKIRRVSMAADLDKVQTRPRWIVVAGQLHVFDIHTEHNLQSSTRSTTTADAQNRPRPDNSYPLTDYFISSSHNTYLLAAQILGKSSAGCYTHVLSRGCRCVEIDSTHGYTLSVSVPFADVCRAIGDYINETYGPYNPDIRSGLDFPILVSLECHVPYDQQADLAQTMKEIWGDRLVQGPIEGIDDDWVRRIVVMVEKDTSGSAKPSRKWDDSSSSSSSESEDSESDGDYFDLGYYARSVKPAKGWLVKRTRIRSTNLDPSKFWRSMQMNEGLFVGTSGWVLKPDHMRKRRNLEFAQGANAQPSVQQKVKLRGHLVGVQREYSPEPNGRRGKTFNTYVRTELFYHRESTPKTMKLQHDPELGADGVWHEDACSSTKDEFGKDDRISTFCSPVDRLVLGEWLLVRLMNTKGKDIGTTALVKFELDV
ncbi:PLC-like phosphodiesterase [Coprinellus micaceus]|uniref:Phosphoinositide phospholipase C n=1 Tax=Coprinellus micaceus TaxID=71717 RepID=A0A4Y7SV77_COPMI|nr:PLC-like phosphodiesterase [Coprinellus micaceus]